MVKVKIAQFKDDELICEYDSIVNAAKSVHGQPSHISECARDVQHRHTHKGYKWRNVDYDKQSVTMGETKN